MPTIVTARSVDDPLLADFQALNDPARRRQVERAGGYFVVEGVLALERLLAEPSWTVRTVALLPRMAARFEAALAATPLQVVVADEDVLREVVGFDLHRGVLASVDRRPVPAVDALGLGRGDVALVAQGVNDHENLGALYRNAAALGAAAVVLDPQCADPFYRRSVRVSLGHVLSVPTATVETGVGGLAHLHRLGFVTLALSPRGEVDAHHLASTSPSGGPTALIVGPEGPGLSDDVLAAAQHRVRIDMAPGVDSLNVATAAAIGLHELRRRAAQ